MYTIDKYKSDIKALTNNFAVKINEIPMAINNYVKLLAISRGEHNRIPKMENKREWKYYLNLAGQMHPYDTPVKITLIEDNTEQVLTAELLRNNTVTRDTLRKMGKYYDYLMEQYPEQCNYIQRCIWPVNIDYAIAAPEGTILAYNRNLVQANEGYLIPKLEQHIKNMLSRWHVKPYSIVDELYLPSFIGFLTASIYLKIINLRLSKIGTYEVHLFHLEHFFRSHMDIWDDINGVLNKPSIMWLYNNMDVIEHNTGKEKTFKKIYDILFQMNHVGIGEYKLNRNDPRLVDNPGNIMTSSYISDDPVLLTHKLNNSYITNIGYTAEVPDMIRDEIETLPDVNKNIPPVFKSWIIDTQTDKTKTIVHGVEKTKILDIDSAKLFKKSGLDFFTIVMDYWVYALSLDKLYKDKIEYTGNIHNTNTNTVKTFVDEPTEYTDVNNTIYLVTPKIGFLMLLKLLLYITGNTKLKLSKVYYNNVMESNLDKYQEAIDTLIINDGGISYPLLTEIKKLINPEPAVFQTLDIFKSYLDNHLEVSKLVWLYICNSQDFIVQANIKKVFHSLRVAGEYQLSDDGKEYTIDELLAQHNVIFPINENVDALKTVKHMIKTFTGVELDQEDVLLANIEKYRTILMKLTSYSLQALGTVSIDKEIVGYYNNPTIVKTMQGYMFAYGLEFNALEENMHRLTSTSKEQWDWIDYAHIPNGAMIAYPDLPFPRGDMVLHRDEIRDNNYPPDYTGDIGKIPSFPLDKLTWSNDWLTVQQLKFSALEDPVNNVKTGEHGNSAGDSELILTKQPQIATKTELYGDLVIKEGPWLQHFTTYDFHTIPKAWFGPELDNFISTVGINFSALEENINGIKTGSTQHDNTDPIQQIVNVKTAKTRGIRDQELDGYLTNEPLPGNEIVGNLETAKPEDHTGKMWVTTDGIQFSALEEPVNRTTSSNHENTSVRQILDDSDASVHVMSEGQQGGDMVAVDTSTAPMVTGSVSGITVPNSIILTAPAYDIRSMPFRISKQDAEEPIVYIKFSVVFKLKFPSGKELYVSKYFPYNYPYIVDYLKRIEKDITLGIDHTVSNVSDYLKMVNLLLDKDDLMGLALIPYRIKDITSKQEVDAELVGIVVTDENYDTTAYIYNNIEEYKERVNWFSKRPVIELHTEELTLSYIENNTLYVTDTPIDFTSLLDEHGVGKMEKMLEKLKEDFNGEEYPLINLLKPSDD